ncbi:MAG: hypothetical protein FWD66_10855 [Paludibacter sp.]|nr:hypothetical protein [Paludibacter sp.]
MYCLTGRCLFVFCPQVAAIALPAVMKIFPLQAKIAHKNAKFFLARMGFILITAVSTTCGKRTTQYCPKGSTFIISLYCLTGRCLFVFVHRLRLSPYLRL